MYESLLLEAGLTKNEAKAYLSLLKLGKSTAGKIVKEANIASGKIYETLYKLLDKGLVETVTENNTKQFIASDPQTVLLYMQERKQQIDEHTQKLKTIIPGLQKIRQTAGFEENVYLIKGMRGIRPIVYDAMQQTKTEAKIMGVRSAKNAQYNIFWQHWHSERINQKKNARLLFSEKNTSYWNFYQKKAYTKTRVVDGVSLSAIMVIDDNSFIFTYEQEFICIHIKSASVAQSFSIFFEDLWTIGKA